MVLRPDSIETRLAKLDEIVSRLEKLRDAYDREDDLSYRDDWAIERGLQLGAEVLFDIGNHILTAGLGVAVEDYEDIVRQLGSHAVIDSELREELQGLGGFRNILVHDYLRLDPLHVRGSLEKAPRLFGEFAMAIRQWLDRQSL